MSTAPSAAEAPTVLPGMKQRWLLDPRVTYLNHGSFGARLAVVGAAQERWRRRFEAEPIDFLDRDRDALLAEAKEAVGAFLGISAESFGFVTNASEGTHAVLRSLRFAPGDEVLTTDHVYGAVRQSLRHLADRLGIVPREIPLELPVAGPEAVVRAFEAAITPRTRLLLVDHVTSPTALRFPVEELVALGAARGVDVLVDGAHAPGMLELDVAAVGAAWYTGNLHKWVGAPVGAAFLHGRDDRRDGIHPTTVSHFHGEGFAAEFAWQGTRDVTPWLAAADAIRETAALLPGGWPALRERNRQAARWAGAHLGERWGVEPIAPDAMLGSMAAVPAPPGFRARFDDEHGARAALRGLGVEVPVIPWRDGFLIRVSAQVYVGADDYARLADAVLALARG